MHVEGSHTPVASGFACWQTRPGPHTGGGPKMFPPQGPPGPETHPHVVAPGTVSQVAPAGQKPPHVPVASPPHGLMHRAAGPGQHARPPAVAQMHACSQTPPWQLSAVHGLPSSQSPSVWQVPGSVVVVVDGGGHWKTQSSSSGHGASGEHVSVVHCPVAGFRHFPTGGGGHSSVQNWFGSGHGWWSVQDWSVHCRSIVSKHFPAGGGGGHSGTQSWFAGHGAVREHEPLHWAVVGSRQVPVGGGGGHCGTHISASGPTKAPATDEHGCIGEHDAPHCPVLRLRQVPVGSGGGHIGRQSWFGSGQGASGPHV
jgi:hypothetical protein